MVAHHDAACTNVLGHILSDIELEFQGLGFFCASFIGEASIRFQVFSKNVDKFVKFKSKRDSVENHALLGLLNGVLHLLCNSTLRDLVAGRLRATSFENQNRMPPRGRNRPIVNWFKAVRNDVSIADSIFFNRLSSGGGLSRTYWTASPLSNIDSFASSRHSG